MFINVNSNICIFSNEIYKTLNIQSNVPKTMDLEDIESTSQTLIGFEADLARLAQEGEINGPAHFSRGNEAQMIKIFRGLRKGDYTEAPATEPYSYAQLAKNGLIMVPEGLSPDDPIFKGIRRADWLFTSYRCHHAALLRGIPPDQLRGEIMKGRSMHPISREHKFVTSALVPGHLPIATGMALALKRRGSSDHVWAFCGDMAAETGTFHECTKYAWRQDLPITFIVEDNGYSVDTPTQESWGLDRPSQPSNGFHGRIVRYAYKNEFPHQGVGKEVGF
jgi:TPP-dependent pyruvate/acetoin dehydrogenase alpha subunit